MELCTELKVDYVGLNFVQSSPRCISIERAIELVSVSSDVKIVGVFQNQSIDEIQDTVNQVGLDVVQLHGEESLADAQRFDIPVIKAFRSVPSENVIRQFLDAGIRVMLDGKMNGEVADWSLIITLPQDVRQNLFLAGGLTSENVVDAIASVQPFAVDAASGVESAPGTKDEEKLRMFIDNIRLSSSS